MRVSSAAVLTFAAIAILTASRVGELRAQEQGLAVGRPEWVPAVRHDTSRPLRDTPPQPAVSTRENFEVKQPPTAASGQPDQATQQLAVAPLAAINGVSFDGVGEGNPQFAYNVNHAPPDTVGEAGKTQYVQWVNPSFAVFDKATGTKLYGPAGGNTLFTGFGGPCESRNDGDPIVQYDQLADRWVMTQFALQSGNYMQCVAVSETEDALGAWHRYAFSYAQFPDYPKLSVWPDAYYITFNMFGATGGSFTGGRICGYDRAQMLSGLPATQVCVQSNAYASALVADLEGKALPATGTSAYVLNRSTSGVNLWRFTPNFTNGTASITGPVALPVAAYTAACGSSCVPQPSTSQRLDALGDRLMYRLSYRNLGTREALVVNHSVVASGAIGIRWYELDVTGGVPSVRQQATYAPNDGLYRWMGSAAMDRTGNIAIGYSVSNASTVPSIRFAGREVSDPLNTLTVETNLHSGTGSQLANLSRWGDYSTMAIDPVDDCTFWYTSEYLKTSGTFNWSTRVGSFRFANCGSEPPPPNPTFSVMATPASRSVAQGASTTFDVTVGPLNGYNGSGTFLVNGLPAGASGSFAPAGFGGGVYTSTLTVTAAANAATGSFPVTITATDSSGTPTQSTGVTLTITQAAVPDFSISATPGNRVIKRGNSGTYAVTIAAVGGFADTVTLSTAGPAGVSFGFTPPSVSGGGSSTLTVTVSSAAAKGTYTLVITGTSAAKTRSTTVTLKVN